MCVFNVIVWFVCASVCDGVWCLCASLVMSGVMLYNVLCVVVAFLCLCVLFSYAN